MAVWLAWGFFPSPARAADEGDPPLAPAEERAALEAVEELGAARAEIDALKAAVQKDAVLVDSLRNQIAALERLSAVQDRMMAAADKLSAAQGRVIEAYEKMAAAERLRADRAETKAERLERWAWAGPVVGILTTVIVGGLIAAFAR